MRRIAIISSRHRGWDSSRPASEQLGSEFDRSKLEELLESIMPKWPALMVVGIGADAGLNRAIREACQGHGIPYAEIRVTFSSHVHPAALELALLARHEAVAALSQEAIILVGRGRMGHVEDLLHVLRRQRVPYVVYDDGWEVTESYDG